LTMRRPLPILPDQLTSSDPVGPFYAADGTLLGAKPVLRTGAVRVTLVTMSMGIESPDDRRRKCACGFRA
jgi:hypothetical protein